MPVFVLNTLSRKLFYALFGKAVLESVHKEICFQEYLPVKPLGALIGVVMCDKKAHPFYDILVKVKLSEHFSVQAQDLTVPEAFRRSGPLPYLSSAGFMPISCTADATSRQYIVRISSPSALPITRAKVCTFIKCCIRFRVASEKLGHFYDKTAYLVHYFTSLPRANAFLFSSRNFAGTHCSRAFCQTSSSKAILVDTTPMRTTFEAFAVPACSASASASTAITSTPSAFKLAYDILRINSRTCDNRHWVYLLS